MDRQSIFRTSDHIPLYSSKPLILKKDIRVKKSAPKPMYDTTQLIECYTEKYCSTINQSEKKISVKNPKKEKKRNKILKVYAKEGKTTNSNKRSTCSCSLSIDTWCHPERDNNGSENLSSQLCCQFADRNSSHLFKANH